jgi:hypothetical protein
LHLPSPSSTPRILHVQLVNDLTPVEPHNDLALLWVNSGWPLTSAPILRKPAHCTTGETSRRAICTTPPVRRLHLRSGLKVETVKVHQVGSESANPAFLLLVTVPRLAS